MGNQDYSGAIKFNRGRANLLNVVAPSTCVYILPASALPFQSYNRDFETANSFDNVDLPSAGDEPTEPSQIEYLTFQDELELVTFYLSKISQLCRASIFNFSETVKATAMSYLKNLGLKKQICSCRIIPLS
ncbi:hypothetical protein PGT21_029991 [Puccinia graminis f. sp. tritici]|uniref:Uncharacterized protein n=1 Tax=Puccinia graminis f. sp. tritici TaxID=56615 RepID=A0A5B0QY22_PUCGR|nr:hypothetical protein PGT21_029991 [Puccinia graminis f. sp. tritici]